MWKIQVFVASVVAILTFGCQGGDGFSPAPPSFLSPTTQTTSQQVQNVETWTAQYFASPPPSNQAELRNNIIDTEVAAIDGRYPDFKESLWRNRNLSDFAFDMTNIALGFTGTIVGGAETKTVTNALVAALTGAKTGINSDFYNQQTAMAIIAKMDALRSTQAALIWSNEKLGVSDYPLQKAVQDIYVYYADGTVLGALQGIASTSGAVTENNNTVSAFVAANQPTQEGTQRPSTTSSSQKTSSTQTSNKRRYNLIPDASGRLHILDSENSNQEIKLDSSGIPITGGKGQ